MTISSSVETITPMRAAELLRRLHSNRPLRPSWVEAIARSMREGNWDLNGQGIILSDKGEVLDGQHRLNAVILAQIPIAFLVTRGVEEKAFRSLDTGRFRNYSDMLSVRLGENAKLLAATARTLFSFQIGQPMSMAGGMQPSPADLDVLIEKNPRLPVSCTFVSDRGASIASTSKKILPPRLAACLHYLFAVVDEEKANDFMDRLLRGVNLSSDDPIYTLRERLMSKSHNFKWLGDRDKAALVIKVWNIVVTGREMPTSLYYRGAANKGTTSRGREAFPSIAGGDLASKVS